jgi:hypothetical protein
MIPGIADILDDLLAGQIDRDLAILWLTDLTTAGTNEADEDMRDAFAMAAVQGMLARASWVDAMATEAYSHADKLMRARTATRGPK